MSVDKEDWGSIVMLVVGWLLVALVVLVNIALVIAGTVWLLHHV